MSAAAAWPACCDQAIFQALCTAGSVNVDTTHSSYSCSPDLTTVTRLRLCPLYLPSVMQVQERQRQLELDAAEEAKVAAECRRLAEQQAAERAAEAQKKGGGGGGMVRRPERLSCPSM